MEKYIYSGGHFFNLRNLKWEEWQGQQKAFVFTETNIDAKWITLHDGSRDIYVSLPINSGKSYYMWGGTQNWVPLYDVQVIRQAPNTIQNLPGCSFDYIRFLIDLNYKVIQPTPVGKELMLAIFWEESPFFNNSFQQGGTAFGFGQVEPYEFYRFDANGSLSQLAGRGNYLVYNLPPRQKVGHKRARILTPLDDYTSVRAACAMVRDLFERGIKTKQGILNGYGTASATSYGSTPRPTIIQNWQNCESALILAQPTLQVQPQIGQGLIVQALRLAKTFDLNQQQQFQQILFP